MEEEEEEGMLNVKEAGADELDVEVGAGEVLPPKEKDVFVWTGGSFVEEEVLDGRVLSMLRLLVHGLVFVSAKLNLEKTTL